MYFLGKTCGNEISTELGEANDVAGKARPRAISQPKWTTSSIFPECLNFPTLNFVSGYLARQRCSWTCETIGFFTSFRVLNDAEALHSVNLTTRTREWHDTDHSEHPRSDSSFRVPISWQDLGHSFPIEGMVCVSQRIKPTLPKTRRHCSWRPRSRRACNHAKEPPDE